MRFKVYADNEAQAEDAAREIKDFISELAKEGKAVTATKIADAIRKYKGNYFVHNYFI